MNVNEQQVTHDNETIKIIRKKYNIYATTSYDENLFEKIKSVTWTKDGNYLKSTKYKKLHQLVIIHFYGEEFLKEAYNRKFVIDHLDNNGYNCTIENLIIIPNNLNISKGHDFDIRKINEETFSINISKDFEHNEFQIKIVLNRPYKMIIDDKEINVSCIYLKYGKDFKRSFEWANSISNDIKLSNISDLNKLRCLKVFIVPTIPLNINNLSEKERKTGIFFRDGQLHSIPGNKNIYIEQIPHLKELHE